MSFNQYLQRLNVFKAFGYDLEKERDFILEKVMPIRGSILELGTGKGHFTIALAQKGYHFISLDISDEEQCFARENIAHLGFANNVEFIIGNAQQLDFQVGRFDNIFAINVIHHLADAFAVIDEMIRVVSPEGQIILGDFSQKGFKLIESIHRSEGREHHKGGVSLKKVAQYLEEKGFCVERDGTRLQEMMIASKKRAV